VILPEGDQVIETFPAEGAEESLAKAIRQGRANWRPKDADAHRGDGRIQAGGKDAVPIVEDEPVAVRLREDLPELLQGPGGGWGGRDVDVQEATAPDFEGDKDIEDAERRRHHHTEIRRHQGLRVGPHEGGPALPSGAGGGSSAATHPAHVPAHRARRHSEAELEQQLRCYAFLPSRRVVPGHGGDQALESDR
jgi:hypothetical protein